MIPQPDIGLVSRFERWVRNRSVVAGGVGVLVGVQFKDAASREFRLIGSVAAPFDDARLPQADGLSS